MSDLRREERAALWNSKSSQTLHELTKKVSKMPRPAIRMTRIWWCEVHRSGEALRDTYCWRGAIAEECGWPKSCHMFERILASPEAIIIEKQEGEHCDDCGSAYSDVYRVDEDLWALLHERAPAGLLCPSCLVRRALSHERTGDAIDQLRAAIEDKGPRPDWHDQVMARCRQEWPTLWAAIDALLVEWSQARVGRNQV